ncbi:hypothetical protein IQ273_03540 [Nodosilinea sp. LEGE 07298]|uniref:DUF6464 family protein n=1 Tax=Nodosilinea sp. LEGE 07298 TaxID=2777970 RepID=UPI00187F4EDD|nr:DUF6464 family protein [Nodosilinea sp. LEGE 07298]MBE9108493.1 hypothetical protein [Nodosilinea sp. LEGE 07298]
MLVIVLIFVVGLTPAIVSAWMSIRADRDEKYGSASPAPTALGQSMLKLLDNNTDLHYVDGMGYMMGDITCDLNARSPYLRCATNPMGPCDGCSAYAPKVFDRQV